MNSLQVFQFHTHQLNVIVDNAGEPWFIAMQVAEILEYTDAYEMTKKLDDDEIQNRQIAGFGNRGVNLINESGLYSAILTSKKPAAKAFKRWVTHEVLPSIRKTGGYLADTSTLQAENGQLKNELLELYREQLRWLQAPKVAEIKKGPWSEDELDQLFDYRAEGMGAGRISQAMGRSYDSVRHQIRRLTVAEDV